MAHAARRAPRRVNRFAAVVFDSDEDDSDLSMDEGWVKGECRDQVGWSGMELIARAQVVATPRPSSFRQ